MCRHACSTLFVIPGGPQLNTPIFCTWGRREPKGHTAAPALPTVQPPLLSDSFGHGSGSAACLSLQRLLRRLSHSHGAARAMEEGWEPPPAQVSGCSWSPAIAGGVGWYGALLTPADQPGSRGKRGFIPFCFVLGADATEVSRTLGTGWGQSSTMASGCTSSCPQVDTDLRVHLLQRAEKGHEGRAPKVGDGAQPREQALVQHLLEVPLTDVLKERLVHVRWHSPAWPGMAWHPPPWMPRLTNMVVRRSNFSASCVM